MFDFGGLDTDIALSPSAGGFVFFLNRGKEGKAEKRERWKKRERKGKAKKAFARFP